MKKMHFVQITAVNGVIVNSHDADDKIMRCKIINALTRMEIDEDNFDSELKRLRKQYSEYFDTNRISIQIL